MVFNFHAGKLAVQSREGTVQEAAHILNGGWIGDTIRCCVVLGQFTQRITRSVWYWYRTILLLVDYRNNTELTEKRVLGWIGHTCVAIIVLHTAVQLSSGVRELPLLAPFQLHVMGATPLEV